MRTKVDAQPVVERLKQRLDHRTTYQGSHELYIWPQEGQNQIVGCAYGPRMIVFSKHAEAVRLALQVLNGKSPSLFGGNSCPAIPAPTGSVLEASVVLESGGAVAARAFLPFISPVLRQSESLRLAVGEQDGTAFGRAHLVARSSETAGQIRTALEGVVAMARLADRF